MHIVPNSFNSNNQPYFVSHTSSLDFAPFPSGYKEMENLEDAVHISTSLGFGGTPKLENGVQVYSVRYEVGSNIESPLTGNQPNKIILRNKTYPKAIEDAEYFFKKTRGGLPLSAKITFGKFIRVENYVEGEVDLYGTQITRVNDNRELTVTLPLSTNNTQMNPTITYNFLLDVNELNRSAPAEGTQDVQNEIKIEISYNNNTNKLILVEE